MSEIKPNAKANFIQSLQAYGNRAANMNIYLFFFLLFLYHVLLLFQGLDIVDEGFHATAYQQIFNDPESVEYSFIFWLTGFIGGVVFKLFPGAGLLGLRIAGALICLSTIILAYRMLRKSIAPGPLKLGLVLLALFINNDPKDLYYNNLSAFFYLLAAYALYTGLTKRKLLLLFSSGLVIGINMFTRLPNLLGPGIGLVIFYWGHSTQKSLGSQIREFVLFLAGCASGVIATLMLMKALGQLPLFLDSIRQLFSISTGASKNDGLNGSYGLANIMVKSIRQYLEAFGFVLSIFSAVIISSLLITHTRQWNWLIRRGIQAAILLYASYFSFSLIKDGIQDLSMINIFTGMSMVAAFYVLVLEKNMESRLICLVGTYIMLTHPLGSAVGIFTVIPYSLWLTFPFAIGYLAPIKDFSVDFSVNLRRRVMQLPIRIAEKATMLLKAVGLAIILLTCFYQILRYPYFCDTHDRLGMTYQVDNKFMHGIFTSQGRARAINELLDESRKYVHANDYVLAYDLMAMYHFWTQTRPYVRNPCPWFYSSQVFDHELELAISRNKNLPTVVMQNVLTIGDGSKWPEEHMESDYKLLDRNRGRNEVMEKFLADHQYREVWNNKVFKILVPGTN